MGMAFNLKLQGAFCFVLRKEKPIRVLNLASLAAGNLFISAN